MHSTACLECFGEKWDAVERVLTTVVDWQQRG